MSKKIVHFASNIESAANFEKSCVSSLMSIINCSLKQPLMHSKVQDKCNKHFERLLKVEKEYFGKQ